MRQCPAEGGRCTQRMAAATRVARWRRRRRNLLHKMTLWPTGVWRNMWVLAPAAAKCGPNLQKISHAARLTVRDISATGTAHSGWRRLGREDALGRPPFLPSRRATPAPISCTCCCPFCAVARLCRKAVVQAEAGTMARRYDLREPIVGFRDSSPGRRYWLVHSPNAHIPARFCTNLVNPRFSLEWSALGVVSHGAQPAGTPGSRILKVVPAPRVLSTPIVPPWARTSCWAMASPSPAPTPTLCVRAGSARQKRLKT